MESTPYDMVNSVDEKTDYHSKGENTLNQQTLMSKSQRKRQVVNLTQGTIWKQILLFALPIMGANLFQQLYTTVDSLVVGRFVSHTALAAVGAAGSVSYLLIGFFMGMGTGAGVIVSQYYGAKDYDKLEKSVHTAVAMSLLFGVMLGLIGVLMTPSLLRLMNTPEDVMDQAVLYLRIIFGGLITMTVYNVGSGILRAVGDSKRPLYYLIIAGVSNTILNLFFVLVVGLGVDGVAYGTILSQLISSILVIANLVRSKEVYRLSLRKIRFHKDIFFEICKIGIPSGIQSMVISLSNVVIQANINVFGSSAMAGYSAASRVDGFVYMPLNAFSLSLTTFTAQNLGAGNIKRVRQGTRTGIIMGLIVTASIGIFVAIFSQQLTQLFSNDKEVIFYGARTIVVLGLGYSLFVFNDILAGVIRGAGNATVPMIISIFNMCIVRILWLTFLLPIWKDFNLVLVCFPMTWALSSACYILYYFKGGWFRRWEQQTLHYRKEK